MDVLILHLLHWMKTNIIPQHCQGKCHRGSWGHILQLRIEITGYRLPLVCVCVFKLCMVDWVLVQRKQDSDIVDFAFGCFCFVCKCSEMGYGSWINLTHLERYTTVQNFVIKKKWFWKKSPTKPVIISQKYSKIQ